MAILWKSAVQTHNRIYIAMERDNTLLRFEMT